MVVYAAESPRLYLQSLNEEDHLEGFYYMMSTPACMSWSTKKLHTNIQQSRDLMNDAMPTPEKPWSERWAVMLKPESASSDAKPQMIGVIAVVREGEIGYRIFPDYWRKGYMSETLKMFIEMFWKMEVNKKYDRLKAAADTENIASLRTLEKAGFIKEEIRVGFYERGSQPGVKSDLQFFYLPRPGLGVAPESGDKVVV